MSPAVDRMRRAAQVAVSAEPIDHASGRHLSNFQNVGYGFLRCTGANGDGGDEYPFRAAQTQGLYFVIEALTHFLGDKNKLVADRSGLNVGRAFYAAISAVRSSTLAKNPLYGKHLTSAAAASAELSLGCSRTHGDAG
jgi:hypothetical protein